MKALDLLTDIKCLPSHGLEFEEDVLRIFQDLDDIEVVRHPNGSQRSPDIRLIKDGFEVFDIECKSRKGDSIFLNEGIGSLDMFYIFRNYKAGRTCFFLGKHLFTKEDYAKIDVIQTEIKYFIQSLNEAYQSGNNSVNHLRIQWKNSKNKDLTLTFEDNETEAVNTLLDFLDD